MGKRGRLYSPKFKAEAVRLVQASDERHPIPKIAKGLNVSTEPLRKWVNRSSGVICTELPNNPGGSITNSAETIAARVIRANELFTPLVWIEHWPKATTGVEETFELVVFSSYEIIERAPYLGETRAWVGDATWTRLDRATVEVLVGGKV